MSQKLNQTIPPSRDHLDEEFWEDVAFVFYNIHDCKELDEIWDPSWKICPVCGADANKNPIKHRKQ